MPLFRPPVLRRWENQRILSSLFKQLFAIREEIAMVARSRTVSTMPSIPSYLELLSHRRANHDQRNCCERCQNFTQTQESPMAA